MYIWSLYVRPTSRYWPRKVWSIFQAPSMPSTIKLGGSYACTCTVIFNFLEIDGVNTPKGNDMFSMLYCWYNMGFWGLQTITFCFYLHFALYQLFWNVQTHFWHKYFLLKNCQLLDSPHQRMMKAYLLEICLNIFLHYTFCFFFSYSYI